MFFFFFFLFWTGRVVGRRIIKHARHIVILLLSRIILILKSTRTQRGIMKSYCSGKGQIFASFLFSFLLLWLNWAFSLPADQFVPSDDGWSLVYFIFFLLFSGSPSPAGTHDGVGACSVHSRTYTYLSFFLHHRCTHKKIQWIIM